MGYHEGVQSLNEPTAWAPNYGPRRFLYCLGDSKGVTALSLSLGGREVAEQMESVIVAKVMDWQERDVQPKVVTVLVEGDAASEYYAKSKARVARRLGIEYEIVRFPHTVSEDTLKKTIRALNHDEEVHGIMLELPLPRHVNTQAVTEMIHPEKDVDGLTRMNRHANITGERGIYPATPLAAVQLLKHYGFSPSGKHVALVGFGQTVGQPLFHLLVRENATVTVCHAGTTDISRHTLAADVIFVAVGKAGLITPDMVHEHHVIVDAGINQVSGNAIVGDVHGDVMNKVRAISPTPGGVGTVTTMQLFANLMTALSWQEELGILETSTVEMA